MNSLPSKRNVPVSFIIALFALIVIAQFLVFASPVHANATTTETTTNEILIVFEVNPDAAGSTTPSGNATYAPGASISILATANSGYAFSGWSVSNASAITITDPPSASTTATINDFGTITANFSPTTEKPAATQTHVTCDPGSVAAGSSTTCTATVSGGSPVTDQTVSWGSAGTGVFDSSDCTLSEGGTCSVSYMPTEVGDGSHMITAIYAGDAAHLNSTGSFTLTVTSGTVIVTTTTTSTAATSGLATVWTDQADYAPVDTPIIYGSGFLPNANITVSVTRPEGTVNTWPTISDGSGGFQAQYATDGLVLGTFTVTATDGTNTATTTFTDSSTSLDPASGPVGTSVSVTGSGFTHAATVTIKYDGTTVVTYPATVTTDSSGHFSATITVPSSTAGSHTVLASDTGLKSDSHTFTVTASISLSPTSGLVGQSVTIAGSGFAASKTVTFTYGGSALTTSPSSVTSSSVGSFSAVTFTVPASVAGDHTVTATDASSNSASATFTVTSAKSDQTITVTTHAPGSAAYGASFGVAATASSGLTVAITASGSCSGSGSGSATITMAGATGTCTVHYNQAGDSSYNAAPEVTDATTAQKASQAITVSTHAPANAVYGSTFSVAASASSGLAVSYSASGVCTNLGATFTMTSGTGTCTVHYNQAGDANYNAAPEVTENTGAQKAAATISVTPYSVTYDGNAHTAAGTATGVKGESLSGLVLSGTTHTIAGDYPTDAWTFTDSTGNYNDASGTVHDSISKVAATINVVGYTGVYDGDAHGATGSATGVKGEDLSSSLDLGSTFTNVPGGTAHWTFAGGTNYNDANGDAAIVISKADAVISVTPYDVTYDGNPHTATGTATGAKSESLSGLDLSGTAHTNAGIYTGDAWTFAGGTNYKDASGTVSDKISRADATLSVNGYTGIYDGNAHGASGTATGVKSEDLSGSLDLGAKYTNVPGGTAHWTFTGGTNYNDASRDVAIEISKADAAIVVTPYSVTYDGDPHTATGTATGAKGESLSGLDLSGTTHTNAGTYTGDAWTFTDVTGNYNGAGETVDDKIAKADALVTVSGYTGVYDGDAHGATGTATGVGGVDLSGSLNLGSSFTNVPGGTAHWTFAGGINYLDESGDVAIVISKATAVISVTPYDVTYDGNSHIATATAKGVKGESLSGLDLSGTTHTNAGTYNSDPWTFTDVTGNYNNANGDVDDKISKAAATINVDGYTGVYDGDAHGASGPATGVKGEDLSSSLNLGDSFTNVPGGTAHWTFTGGTNYNDASGDVSILISKADATIVVTPYDVTYDGNAHTATGSATGVKGEALSGLDLSGTTHTIAGDYPTDAWTFTGGTNYNDASGTVSDKISKADATIVVTPYDVPYDGNAHTATGSAKGVKGESLSGLDLSGTTHTNAGTYTGDAWTFTDVTGNYNGAGETVDDKISKKVLTVTANSDSKTFGETYTFAGTEFTTLGLVNPPDTVTSVTLASDGAAATATVGSYDIVGSDAVGTGLSNYDITYNKGTLTVDQRPTTTTITAASVQYSDPITLTATVSPITSGDQKLTGSVEFFISDVSVGSQSIDESGVAKLSGILNSRAAGSYDVRAVFASKNSNFAGSEGTGTLSVTKESTKIEYTGDTSVFTAGPTINKAPIRLSAKLTQEDDHYPGDLTLAKVTFELTPGAGGGSTIAVANIPVSATGDALTTTEQVPVGDYYVKVTISSGNSYWTQSEIGAGILDVVVGSNEQRVTGGGWIPDSKSANGKDNFGFTVNYNKNGAPKGSFLFMFRGADGYNYQVKSNSWAKGGLSFTSANTAYFTAKCTIQKIDRTTGIAESLGGDYTFVVNIKDGDLMNPKTLDTFTVTIFDSSNNIWKQVGTASSQITLGGGNIVVHSK